MDRVGMTWAGAGRIWARGGALLLVAVGQVACSGSVEGSDEPEPGAIDLGSTWQDQAGHTWYKVRRVEYVNAPFDREAIVPAAPAKASRSLDQIVLEAPLEVAAEMLRPVMEIGGYEYTMAQEDAIQMTAAIRERLSKADFPESDASAGESVAEKPPLLEDRKLIPGFGDWAPINAQAATWPYSMVATMDRSATDPSRGSAFKWINHHTSMTAAHGMWVDGDWSVRYRMRFAAGGGASAKPYVSANCYARTVPNCYIDAVANGGGDTPEDRVCDFSVLTMRGQFGANCTFSTYDTGFFGYDDVGPTETNVETRQASYPGTPPSGTYPVLYFQSRTDGWAQGEHLRYHNDTLGGSSGSPVYNSAIRLRALHDASCGTGSCDFNYGMRVTGAMISFTENYLGN